MIISHIIGGLGNQMFQYAVGRSLSLEFSQSLYLDVSGFSGYGLHQGFELQKIFDCQINLAGKSEIDSVLGWQSHPTIRRILARPALKTLRKSHLVLEPHFNYWPGIMGIPNDAYLAGYWQSEKYFKKYESVIRADFAFSSALVDKNVELARQIVSVNAVSLHVRRGDYVNNPKTTATHGLCSLEYYKSALQVISSRVEHPVLFVFSDDIAWVKENLKSEFPCQYVDWNSGGESYNDMHLMSLCKHHIIANSSFSWWGAWLNSSSKKIVVAPERWFANVNDVSDLIPSEWIKI